MLKDRIFFRSGLLGERPTRRLRNVKGKFLVFRSSPPSSDLVDIYLDDALLGEARIISCHEVRWANEIQKPNVHMMAGFDSPAELIEYLHRAGYRRVLAHKVIFMAEWGTESFLNWRRQEPKPKPEPVPAARAITEAIPPQPDTRLDKREERLAAGEARLESEKRKLDASWQKLEQKKKELEVTEYLENFDEAKANSLAERLRKELADLLTSPSGKEFRMWQIRTASEILSYLVPYLRVDLALATKNWLKLQSPEGE